MSPVYVPAHIRANTDLSRFYEKAPQEMSRYELKELERVLLMTEEEKVEESERISKEIFDKHGHHLTSE